MLVVVADDAVAAVDLDDPVEVVDRGDPLERHARLDDVLELLA